MMYLKRYTASTFGHNRRYHRDEHRKIDHAISRLLDEGRLLLVLVLVN